MASNTTDMETYIPLLACPFCGSCAKQVTDDGWNFIYCANNDCLAEPCTPDFKTPEEAVTAWNTRAR